MCREGSWVVYRDKYKNLQVKMFKNLILVIGGNAFEIGKVIRLRVFSKINVYLREYHFSIN